MASLSNSYLDGTSSWRSYRSQLTVSHLTAFVVIVTYLPLLFIHGCHLWSRPHYQFFPLYLVGMAALLWAELPTLQWTFGFSRRAMLASGILFCLGVLLLLAAVIWFSPWLAAVSAMLVAGAAVSLAHPSTRRVLLPLWLILWLLVPPPIGLDMSLVLWMQRGVTKIASEQLDLFGINHLSLGTILVFPGKQLLVEEACSGVRSLFTLLASVALYSVWCRIGILPVAVLSAAAFFWAFLANSLRVVAIAVGYDAFGIDLSVGWAHHLLGFAVFSLAIGLMASTCVLVRVFLAPIHVSPMDCGSWINGWNWLVGSGLDGGQDEVDERAAAEPFDEEAGEPVCGLATLRTWQCWSIFAIFVAIGGLQMGSLIRSRQTLAGESPARGAMVDESYLPQQDGTWVLSGYRQREGSEDSQSPYSHVWTYQSPHYAAIAAFDYPYDGPHDLSVCYQGLGWKLVDQRVVGEAVRRLSPSRWPFQVVECVKPLEQHGLLLFCAFDEMGEPLDPPLSIKSDLSQAFFGRLKRRSLAPRIHDTYQVRMFVSSDYRLSESEQADVVEHFLSVRQAIRDRWVRGGSNE